LTKNTDFSPVELNARVLTLMQTEVKNPLSPQQQIKFRQYFLQRAVGAQTLKELFYSLKALKSSMFEGSPYLKRSGLTMPVFPEGKVGQASFELQDMLGQSLLSAAVKIEKAQLTLDGSTDSTDVTKQAQQSGSTLSFKASDKLKPGRYHLTFSLKAGSTAYPVSTMFRVAGKLTFKQVQYKFQSTKNAPIGSFGQFYSHPN
jgi:hypothetical protein